MVAGNEFSLPPFVSPKEIEMFKLFKNIGFSGVAACALLAAVPAGAAEDVKIFKSETTGTYADGTTYERHTTVTRAPIKPGAVTFYYFDPEVNGIVAGNELTDEIILLWDTNSNHVIDNHEFYNNAMVVYEPVEYTKRTFQDIDGQTKLTKEEYSVRMKTLPAWRHLNKDGSEGLDLYEFTGVGFQDADHDNNNQVSYDELRTAFFAKEGLIRKPLKINN